MSEIIESDREQLDKLKKWWEENGRTTTFGLVIGLGAVFGWTAWQSYQLTRAEAASSLYSEVVNAARDGRDEDLRARADTLLAEFPDSGYAVLATLHLARQAAAEGRDQEATARLEWVLANASLEAYAIVARLRLVRLAIDAGDPGRARTLLDGLPALTPDSAYASTAMTLRGDVERLEGKADAARQTYTEALALLGEDTAAGQRVAMKLADLGTWNIEP